MIAHASRFGRACRAALCLALLGVRAVTAAEPPDPAAFALARELAERGDHDGAAVEYRRLALRDAAADRRGGWRWMAGHAYWRAGRLEQAEAMADRAESESAALLSPALLLRAEIARSDGRRVEAAFYLDSFAAGADRDDAREYARRAGLALRLETGDVAGARAAMADWPDAPAAAADAVERYAAGRGRSPRLGGALGLVPGLGYAYAGEYANAFRSLLLNGLFLYGMVDTAEDRQWGAFAAIAFFEITWYSGSIYGGIDASHRYNRRRADAAAAAVRAGAAWEPDPSALPTIRLQFTF